MRKLSAGFLILVALVWLLHAGLLMLYVLGADHHPLLLTVLMVIYVLAPLALMFGAAVLIDGSKSQWGRAFVIAGCAVLTLFAIQALLSPSIRNQLSYVIVLLLAAAMSDVAGCNLVRGRNKTESPVANC